MSEPSSKIESNDPQNWLGEYGDYLYRYALYRVSKRVIAEDLVQETFLAALKDHAKFDHKSSLKTWLTSILRHKITDHFRKTYKTNKNKVDLEYESMDYFVGSGKYPGRWKPEYAPKDWPEFADGPLHQKEFMQILTQCLNGLPNHIAAVFKLRELEYKSTDEICKELEITSTNFWVIMHRARTKLRRCLEVHWFDK
jgi:RNA polymerase sigma-70 factor (ECF subfamily)